MADPNNPVANTRTESAIPKEHGARPRWLRFGSALISVALATLACLLLDPILSAHPHYLWYLCTFMFTAWYGGVGPACLHLVLSPLALAFFVLDPPFDIRVESPSDQFGLMLYCITAIALFIHSRAGGFMRQIVKSSLEQGPLREMPRRVDEIEVKLAKSTAQAELAEQRLTVQFRVSQILSGAACIKDAARPILQSICETLGWEIGQFWLLGGHARYLQCIESWAQSTDTAEEFQKASDRFRFSKGEGFPGRVWSAGSVVWISDMAQDLDLPRWNLAAKAGLHEAIGIPIRNGVQFLAVMEFMSRAIGKPDVQLNKTMSSIGQQISQFIEGKHAEKTVQEHHDDRQLARQIQEGLLPTVMPAVPGFQIAGRSQFATEVGGDYFDFMPMQVECEDCLGIVVGDAAGHGLASALLIAETRAYLQALSLTLNQPDKMLALANRRLANGSNGIHLVTLLLVRLDPGRKALIYAGAGHCPGYILDPQGQTKVVLASDGLPLGVSLSSEFSASSEVALEIGDLIVLYTDGIVETFSPEGKLFTSERLLASIRQHRERRPDEILDALFLAATDHAQGADQADDATAVILKVEATR
jgi:sigma-B regulation protein RsbU (phosphoserine phosphatase)